MAEKAINGNGNVAREDFSFFHRLRVRYAEVDPQMVVFNSRYLEYADLVLTDFWRTNGVALMGPDTFDAHVLKAAVEYVKPARFDEELDAMIRVSRFGNSSMTMLVELHGADEDDLRAKVELLYVQVDLATGKPFRISDDIRRRLSDERTET